MTQESVCRDIFGPKLFLETGDQRMSLAGRTAYTLQSTTDSGFRYVQGHYESGLTRLMTEGKLQIEAGKKNEKETDTNVLIQCWNGNVDIKSETGSIKLTAKQIVLDASKEIVLESGERILIGSKNINSCREVKIQAQNVDIKSKRGAFAQALGGDLAIKAFDSTYVSDIATAALSGNISGGVLKAAQGFVGGLG